MTLTVLKTQVKSSACEKLHGIKLDSKLNFKDHLDGVITKTSRKVNVLSLITPCINIAKRRLLINSFFSSHFNYCSFIWIFRSRRLNNKINHLRERCLRVVYSDDRSSFEDLLVRMKVF